MTDEKRDAQNKLYHQIRKDLKKVDAQEVIRAEIGGSCSEDASQ